MDSRKDDAHDRKEDTMSAPVDVARPCSIEESIIEACKEVSLMRAGKIPKRSLAEFFSNLEKWSKEESDQRSIFTYNLLQERYKQDTYRERDYTVNRNILY